MGNKKHHDKSRERPQNIGKKNIFINLPAYFLLQLGQISFFTDPCKHSQRKCSLFYGYMAATYYLFNLPLRFTVKSIFFSQKGQLSNSKCLPVCLPATSSTEMMFEAKTDFFPCYFNSDLAPFRLACGNHFCR